jgi:hypothetical protein
MNTNVNFRVPQNIDNEIIFNTDDILLTLYYYNIIIESNANFIEHVSRGDGYPVVQLIQGASVELLSITLENRTDTPYGYGKAIHCQGTFSTAFNIYVEDNFNIQITQQPLNSNISLPEKIIMNSYDESEIANDFLYYLDIPQKIVYIYNGDDITKNLYIKFYENY